MNAVEIEEAISALAEQPFDATEFPYAFLQAFGNKETTLKRLRSGASNKSDLGGVLQTNNIHLAVAESGTVTEKLRALKDSPATTRGRVKFILATDGEWFEAEDIETGETINCPFRDFPNHFGFFLALAGISTVKQLRDSSFDIRATGRLNKLYMELLRDNPEWGTAERRRDMNHFMARLIFCFFAEDTNIFHNSGLFTATIEQMSARDASDTHIVIGSIFRAMNMKPGTRLRAGLRPWADAFPYVNGGLFSGSADVPRFSKIARTYLLHIGGLNWRKINPDIFGSMIQAVADDEERGSLGMHYTSVPNILKVLNPLFLDDLRKQLEEAGDNGRKLLNLRSRMARIRVFDPACGSGNFLVIAYKEMRAIEAEINARRGEKDQSSAIPLTNFRGIEIREFPAEIARLALIIAEFQCDVLHRGEKLALAEFLPLDSENWIICGNALRLDWVEICPPSETDETFICGNPPYLGSKWQSHENKDDLSNIFINIIENWKSLDYVSGWIMKAAQHSNYGTTSTAFVTTNSICQGIQASILWEEIFRFNQEIRFAYSSFKWSNLANHNAGVTVSIIGLSKASNRRKILFISDIEKGIIATEVDNINSYLVSGKNIYIQPRTQPISDVTNMQVGNHPYYGSSLIFSIGESRSIVFQDDRASKFIRSLYGAKEFISASPRSCLWIEDHTLDEALNVPEIASRVEAAQKARAAAKQDSSAQKLALTPHKFREQITAKNHTIIIPKVSSENRPYLPTGLLDASCIVQEKAFALYDAPLWNMALIASRLHWVWIGTVCVRMRTDFSYSNTLGWNTFPVPTLTEKNKADLTRCAEDILLAREAHFPATIADLYDPDTMPANLREVHERNDEVLERIYIGRRFRNDTERLEKLFELYTKMTAAAPPKRAGRAAKGRVA